MSSEVSHQKLNIWNNPLSDKMFVECKVEIHFSDFLGWF